VNIYVKKIVKKLQAIDFLANLFSFYLKKSAKKG